MKTITNAKDHDAVKRTINAPCIVVKEDASGRKVRHVPAVDCEWDCEKCGFNPRVANRRLEARYGNCKIDH